MMVVMRVRHNDPPSMDNSWNPSENRQNNVDAELGIASNLDENSKRRKENGENTQKNISTIHFYCR